MEETGEKKKRKEKVKERMKKRGILVTVQSSTFESGGAGSKEVLLLLFLFLFSFLSSLSSLSPLFQSVGNEEGIHPFKGFFFPILFHVRL